MKLGRIVGTVVSTRKDPSLDSLKLLIVENLTTDLGREGGYVVAVDSVGAGLGEVILYATGSSARLTAVTKDRPVDAVIMGIVFVQNVTMLEVWTSVLKWLENAVGTTNYAVTFSINFAVDIALPVDIMGLTYWIAGKFNKINLVENFTRFGYAIIALDVAGHIAHNLFHLLAEGKSMKEVGAILDLTTRTVAFHKYRMMEQLGLKSSAELVTFAVRSGVVA